MGVPGPRLRRRISTTKWWLWPPFYSEKATEWQPTCGSSPQLQFLTCAAWPSTGQTWAYLDLVESFS